LTSLFHEWRTRTNPVLQGASDDEAFFIVCDSTNNTAQVIASNKIIIRIGLAFQHPSRFVEITLEQDTRAVEAALAG
jgi:phage tail sheath protein FI